MRRLMQGPISDLEDETKVGDIVFIEDDASPAGNHMVTGIIFRRCIKHLVQCVINRIMYEARLIL